MNNTGRFIRDPRKEVWLLPHPDDELFCIDHEKFPNSELHIFYFCRLPQKISNKSHIDRFEEAISAWNQVKNVKVILHNTFCRFSDGQIFSQFSVQDYLELKIIVQNLNPTHIVTPTFEGGHQDHDFIYAVARNISLDLNISHLDFPTYKARRNSRFFFRAINSRVPVIQDYESTIKSNIRNSFLIGKMALKYKSQYKSLWILYPLLVIGTFRGKRGRRLSNPTLEYLDIPFFQLRRRADSNVVLEAIENLEKYSHER